MTMMTLFTISVVNAIRYLRTLNHKYDIYARQFAVVGIVFGLLGYATGSIWMSYTWADPNNPTFDSFSALAREPKLIGAAIALLIYFAYLVLRDSITDMDKRARISAVYNIFAYAMLFPTIWIMPRLLPSLHPGQEGNPALNFKDVSSGYADGRTSCICRLGIARRMDNYAQDPANFIEREKDSCIDNTQQQVGSAKNNRDCLKKIKNAKNKNSFSSFSMYASWFVFASPGRNR